MADFTAIQIGTEKINVKDETARTAAEQAATDATAAETAAEQAVAKVESISLTYNGTDTIIWKGGN